MQFQLNAILASHRKSKRSILAAYNLTMIFHSRKKHNMKLARVRVQVDISKITTQCNTNQCKSRNRIRIRIFVIITSEKMKLKAQFIEIPVAFHVPIFFQGRLLSCSSPIPWPSPFSCVPLQVPPNAASQIPSAVALHPVLDESFPSPNSWKAKKLEKRRYKWLTNWLIDWRTDWRTDGRTDLTDWRND